MEIVSCPKKMQGLALDFKRRRETIGFVPTMGALHEGHLSLVGIASAEARIVVASIFINPKQFNDPKDLEKYPRMLERDAQMLESAGAHFLFAPDSSAMYGSAFQTTVGISRIAAPLEGKHRPGHFDGVATVVSLLFNIVQPDCAIFGEKDFQQLRVIETLVDDLKFPIEIIRGPTVREPNGLAMSSRNARLSPDGRSKAAAISSALFRARDEFAAHGSSDLARIAKGASHFISSAGLELEYVDIVDEETLLPPSGREDRLRLLAAARLEGVRLIDNIALLKA